VDGDHRRAHRAVRRHGGPAVRLEPLSFPVDFALLAHAWAIPELYARRGANVVRPKPRGDEAPERVAVGLLGDLVGHDARELHARTGLVPERGALGVWLVGEAGAVLVRAGGRRVFCWCVKVPEPGPAAADRIATCCSRLRSDEQGFATVAQPRVQRCPRGGCAGDAPAHAARARRGVAVVQGAIPESWNIGQRSMAERLDGSR
jgi:hypothetical protein